jgi:hypothetical protein
MRVFLCYLAMIASARQRSNECRICRSPLPHSSSRDHELATVVASGHSCSEEQDRGGGRNARATSRTLARFWKFFPFGNFACAYHRCHWLCRSSGKLRNAHVSLDPLSFSLLRVAIPNRGLIVQNLWTT